MIRRDNNCPTDHHVDNFTAALLSQDGLSRNTVVAYCCDIQRFSKVLERQGTLLTAVREEDIRSYLAERVKGGYNARSNARFVSSVRRFYRYLLREGEIENDPTGKIAMTKSGQYLPSSLTESEVEMLLAAAPEHLATGLRDKAMLELLYACGLRVSELVGLEIPRLFLDAGYLRVSGKGGKERLIPIGEQAVESVQRYMDESRPVLLAGRGSCKTVFVTRRGSGMTRQAFWYVVKKLARQAGIKRHLSPHTLRHAFATHLLDHDADLRTVQMLLGHSNLSTTQIYTHVAVRRMKALHRTHHPRG